uniref:Uncharacterized protein n=1 Tax=Arundo donax TaxID=35708 RepID=A0A0A9CWD8_ARUDO
MRMGFALSGGDMVPERWRDGSQGGGGNSRRDREAPSATLNPGVAVQNLGRMDNIRACPRLLRAKVVVACPSRLP